MGVSKTSDHVQIKIKMPNPSQEPFSILQSPQKDLKDMAVLCTFNIKAKIWNMTVSKTIDHIQIKINIPNTSQEHPASFTSPNQDFVLAPKLSR